MLGPEQQVNYLDDDSEFSILVDLSNRENFAQDFILPLAGQNGIRDVGSVLSQLGHLQRGEAWHRNTRAPQSSAAEDKPGHALQPVRQSLRCLIGLHDWGVQWARFDLPRGGPLTWCKCRQCGKVRNKWHAWSGCKCDLCGRVRDEWHKWDDDGLTCTKCGSVRSRFSESWHCFDALLSSLPEAIPRPEPEYGTRHRLSRTGCIHLLENEWDPDHFKREGPDLEGYRRRGDLGYYCNVRRIWSDEFILDYDYGDMW